MSEGRQREIDQSNAWLLAHIAAFTGVKDLDTEALIPDRRTPEEKERDRLEAKKHRRNISIDRLANMLGAEGEWEEN